MVSVEEIINFLKRITRAKDISPESDIYEDLKVGGDDFHEMMDEYSKIFKVEMSEYLWYFHCDEEGLNTGGLFFKPPYKRVKRIPITPILMVHFANTGKWEIDYPYHKLPKYRLDILINIIIGIVVLVAIIYSYL